MEKLALVTLLEEYGDFPGNPKNRDLTLAPAQRLQIACWFWLQGVRKSDSIQAVHTPVRKH